MASCQLLFILIFLSCSSEVFGDVESMDCTCGLNARYYNRDDDSTTCQCECLKKYEGDPLVACTPIPDPCLINPCGLGADCNGHENGTRSCKCPNYYEGNPEKSCKPLANPCHTISCGPDSTPVPSSDFTTCSCENTEKEILKDGHEWYCDCPARYQWKEDKESCVSDDDQNVKLPYDFEYDPCNDLGIIKCHPKILGGCTIGGVHCSNDPCPGLPKENQVCVVYMDENEYYEDYEERPCGCLCKVGLWANLQLFQHFLVIHSCRLQIFFGKVAVYLVSTLSWPLLLLNI